MIAGRSALVLARRITRVEQNIKRLIARFRRTEQVLTATALERRAVFDLVAAARADSGAKVAGRFATDLERVLNGETPPEVGEEWK